MRFRGRKDGCKCPCHNSGHKILLVAQRPASSSNPPSSQVVGSRRRAGFAGRSVFSWRGTVLHEVYGGRLGGAFCTRNLLSLYFDTGGEGGMLKSKHKNGTTEWLVSRQTCNATHGQCALLASSSNFDSTIKNFHICWSPLKSVTINAHSLHSLLASCKKT